MYSNLIKYGFSDRFEKEAALYGNLYVARVTRQHHELYKVIGEHGEMNATVSGKFVLHAGGYADYPAVGDFVMIDRDDAESGNAIIHHILTRKSIFTRKTAGRTSDEQVVAANIDTVFICISLNADFNLRRIERYLTIAWESKALPVVVLTKSDLCCDLEDKLTEISAIARGVDLVVCSAENADGLNAVQAYVQPGKTIAFIGSSGVGKSTLINRLIGEDVLVTKAIREGDDKGRHTTTFRQLILLPNGGIVIDTPGMREIGIYSGNLSRAFEDIEELALTCKYSDCVHITEPGCAVRQAIENGTLEAKRLENYQKLRREMSYEGLNTRQLENEKVNRMFGSKAEMKQAFKHIKGRKK